MYVEKNCFATKKNSPLSRENIFDKVKALKGEILKKINTHLFVKHVLLSFLGIQSQQLPEERLKEQKIVIIKNVILIFCIMLKFQIAPKSP